MKKIYFLVSLLFLFFFTNSYSQVRSTRWGCSMDSVKKVEKLKLVNQSKEDLTYNGIIDGDEYNLIYGFHRGKLASVTYIYNETHVNKNLYVEKFYKLRELILLKYPSKYADREVWKDDLYKEDPSSYGLAISAGHLQLIYAANNRDLGI